MESTLNQEDKGFPFRASDYHNANKKELAQTLLDLVGSGARFSSFCQLESFLPSTKRQFTRKTNTKYFMLTAV